MEIESNQIDGVTILALFGTLDALTAAQLEGAVESALSAEERQLVLNLADLIFLSSAGLRTLITATRAAREHDGDLRVAAVSERVRRVLELAGFDRIVPVFDTVDDAVTSYTDETP
ncbi:MAG: STAS domain-containing protein [Chloroflexi bacterium]|nr:STAS domain-containing protein [Chloroflexota bacterium]